MPYALDPVPQALCTMPYAPCAVGLQSAISNPKSEIRKPLLLKIRMNTNRHYMLVSIYFKFQGAFTGFKGLQKER